mmetsp:Transcript_26749/g.80007  ORF Transcript_26749/g.80007 Transcript_26749/m.80007 type:complete len:151 (+) Transcript_26749:19-471(+)
MAALRGHVQVMESLRSRGAHLDRRDNSGSTPLALAAAAPAEELLPEARERSLRWLIAAGAALGSVDNAGSTPLLAAAAAGQAASVSLLASAGADADATRADGRTALHIAAESGDLQVVRALRASGAAGGGAALEAAIARREHKLIAALQP